MRCKHNSPRPQLGFGRHLVCLSITRSAKESSCVFSRNVKCPPQLPWQSVELLHTERSEPPKRTQNTALYLLSIRGGQPDCQGATGGRAAPWGLQLAWMQGRAAPSMENPSMAQAQRAAHREPLEKVPQSLPTGHLWKPPAHCRLPEYWSWCSLSCGHQQPSELSLWRGTRDSSPRAG